MVLKHDWQVWRRHRKNGFSLCVEELIYQRSYSDQSQETRRAHWTNQNWIYDMWRMQSAGKRARATQLAIGFIFYSHRQLRKWHGASFVNQLLREVKQNQNELLSTLNWNRSKFSSHRRDRLLFLKTNMATMTSPENQQVTRRANSLPLDSPLRHGNDWKQSERCSPETSYYAQVLRRGRVCERGITFFAKLKREPSILISVYCNCRHKCENITIISLVPQVFGELLSGIFYLSSLIFYHKIHNSASERVSKPNNYTPYREKHILLQQQKIQRSMFTLPRDLSTCKKMFNICNAILNVTQRTTK